MDGDNVGGGVSVGVADGEKVEDENADLEGDAVVEMVEVFVLL